MYFIKHCLRSRRGRDETRINPVDRSNNSESIYHIAQTRWPVKTLKPGSPLFTYVGADDQNFTIPKTRAGLYWFEIKSVESASNGSAERAPGTVLLYATSSALDHVPGVLYTSEKEHRHRSLRFQQRRSKRRLTISWNKRYPSLRPLHSERYDVLGVHVISEISEIRMYILRDLGARSTHASMTSSYECNLDMEHLFFQPRRSSSLKLLFSCHLGLAAAPVDALRGAKCSENSSAFGSENWIVLEGASPSGHSGRSALRAADQADAS